MEKFAWLPTMVWTWRHTPTKALVWLQKYNVNDSFGPYIPLSGPGTPGEKWVNRLGFFSHEF